MKILVLSDSHGNLSNMVRAVDQSAPRMILHLGDCWRDGEKLHELMVRVDRQHLVDLLALPQLVRFAEADDFSRETVLPYLRRALAPFDLSASS